MSHDTELQMPMVVKVSVWCGLGGLLGALFLSPFGRLAWGSAFLLGMAPVAVYIVRHMLRQFVLENTGTKSLPAAIAPMLQGAEIYGARELIGSYGPQTVEFSIEGSVRRFGVRFSCRVRAPRGTVYLTRVSAEDLDVERVPGTDDMVIQPSEVTVTWDPVRPPDEHTARNWVRSILDEADARLVSEGHRLVRLVELAEDSRPSALLILASEEPEHPRLAELAERLTQSPMPAARLIGSRWLGPEALDVLINELANEPVWQAKALRARAEVAELPADAIQRWAGVPGLHLELLIDQIRRGPIDAVNGLVDAVPAWAESDDERLLALAATISERGPEVEPAARRLFDAQPAGRRHLARALGDIGGTQSLATLHAARAALDWPQFDGEEAAVERAIAQISHRVGDAAAGMLALDQHVGEAGGLSLGAEAAGGLAVAQQSERE